MRMIRPETIAVVLVFATLTSAYKQFQERIPNGKSLSDPCNSNKPWGGVGHTNSLGGGQRNVFGRRFAAEGSQWSSSLCNEDSDGDGRTNGAELGDPSCTWRADSGSRPQFNATSHPGFKDPVSKYAYNASDETTLNCAKEEAVMNCSAAVGGPDVQWKEIRMPANTSIPAQETTYRCYDVALPADKKYHVSASQALLDNLNIVHHMILFSCSTPISSMSTSAPYDCLMASSNCGTVSILAGWTFGRGDSVGCFPEDVPAAPALGKGTSAWAVLQVHWNNPLLLQGQTDTSGIRIYFTPHLRPNDMGTLFVGQRVLSIPPERESVTVTGSCRFSDCVSSSYNRKPIGIVTVQNHMHLLGRAGETVVYRLNDTRRESPIVVARDHPFKYDDPVRHYVDPPLMVYPGDEIEVSCTYSSRGQQKVTRFGEGTQDEMCFGIVSYYPRSDERVSGLCADFGAIDYCNFVRLVSASSLLAMPRPPACNPLQLLQSLATAALSPCFGTDSSVYCSSSCLNLLDEIFSSECMMCNSTSRTFIENLFADNEIFLAFRQMRRNCQPENSNAACTDLGEISTEVTTSLRPTTSSASQSVENFIEIAVLAGIAVLYAFG